MKIRNILLLGVLLLISFSPGNAGSGNRFAFAQLQHRGNWNPYPQIHQPILKMIVEMTNIPVVQNRRVVRLGDPALFDQPFLLIKGSAALSFKSTEQTKLKEFIDRGGMVFFDDTLADPSGPFSRSVRELLRELYPDKALTRLDQDHALFRSFFLLRSVGGRRISQKFLEGLDVGGQGGGEPRTAVIYCPNDLLGAWMKDNLGNYLYHPEPGGESQRWESFKLTLNLIYFSITGTYKKDAIHQPFIERKLGH